jgi:hypothetical protein
MPRRGGVVAKLARAARRLHHRRAALSASARTHRPRLRRAGRQRIRQPRHRLHRPRGARGQMLLLSESHIVEVLDAAGQPVAARADSARRSSPASPRRLSPSSATAPATCCAWRPTPLRAGRGCTCIAEVSGRQTDLVVAADGRVMHALAGHLRAARVEGIAQFKLRPARIDRCRSADRRRRALACGDGIAAHRKWSATARLGDSLRVELRVVDHIAPEASGKHRYVVSHVPLPMPASRVSPELKNQTLDMNPSDPHRLPLRYKPWRARHLRLVLRDLRPCASARGRASRPSARRHRLAVPRPGRARRPRDAGGVAAGWSFEDGWLPGYPETTGYIIETFLAAAPSCSARTWSARPAHDRLGAVPAGRRRCLPRALRRARQPPGDLQPGPDHARPGRRLHPARPPGLPRGRPACRALAGGAAGRRRLLPQVRAQRRAARLQHAGDLGCWPRPACCRRARSSPPRAATSTGRSPSRLQAAGSPPTPSCPSVPPSPTPSPMPSAASSRSACCWASNATCRPPRPARGIMAVQREDGWLAGTYSDGWTAQASYACVTGVAQMALCWLRLHQISGDEAWRHARLPRHRLRQAHAAPR